MLVFPCLALGLSFGRPPGSHDGGGMDSTARVIRLVDLLAGPRRWDSPPSDRPEFTRG